MTARPAPLLALALLLAGCSLPQGSEAPPATTGSCPDVAEASASAPLLSTLQDDPEVVARRLGEALGANVTGPPEPLPGGELRWRDGDRSVTVTPGEDSMRVAWERAGAWSPSREEAEALLRRAIGAFAPPDPAAFEVVSTNGEGPVHLQAMQTYEGRRLMDAGAWLTSGAHAGVVVQSLREVRPGLDLIDEARAAVVATRAARCALDQDGRTEDAGHAVLGADPPMLGARGGSLAWVVDVRFAEPDGPSHCGHVERVRVDAVTEKVLSIERPACD